MDFQKEKKKQWFTFPISYLLRVFAEVVVHFHAAILSFTHVCMFVLWCWFSIHILYVPCLRFSAQLFICCLSIKVTQSEWKNVPFKGSHIDQESLHHPNKYTIPASSMPVWRDRDAMLLCTRLCYCRRCAPVKKRQRLTYGDQLQETGVNGEIMMNWGHNEVRELHLWAEDKVNQQLTSMWTLSSSCIWSSESRMLARCE